MLIVVSESKMRPTTVRRWFLMFWVLFCACGGDATLKTSFVEDICTYENAYTIDLKYQNTGILMSIPAMNLGLMDCRITILPRHGFSVVLSIYRYDLLPEDQLIVEDSDRHKVALIGWASFPNEKKSIISEGRMVLHYKMNNTHLPQPKRGFQFTFTEVHNSPCASDEFQCKNGKCLSKQLMCKGHNHCGDNSENENCVPKKTIDDKQSFRQQSSPYTIVWTISIGVAACVLLIVVVVFVVVLVRMRQKKSTTSNRADAPNNVNSNNNLQSVSATVPSNADPALSGRSPQPTASGTEPQFQQPTSFFNNIRRSLRGLRAPKKEENSLEETKPEVYQVPSMYPSLDHLPSAPALEGIENTNFTIEE